MSKHTPGPWGTWIDDIKYGVTGPSAAHAMIAENAIKKSDLNGAWKDSFHVVSSVGRVSCLALGDTEVEARANARLIAAAPDLLEALQEALDHQLVTEGPDWWGKALAAVSKATGQS